MWFIDVLLAFPALVFALALVSFAGPKLSSVLTVFAVLAIPGYARVARALTLTYATENFVLAAQATGARSIRVMTREILPNVIVPLASFAALGGPSRSSPKARWRSSGSATPAPSRGAT